MDPLVSPPITPERPVLRVADQREAEIAVAGEIASLVREHQSRGRGTTLGLATGRTMVGVYRQLVRHHREEGLDLSTTITFNLDEYAGYGAEDPDSFRCFMDEHLFDHVNIPGECTYVPDGRIARLDVDEYCAGYEDAIRRAGGIDLQLLGVGRNGHVAFNEPGSARDSRTRLVELDGLTKDDAKNLFGDRGVPRHAITMGVATVLEARRLRVLAFGARKAEIVRRATTEPVGPELPATWLRGHPDVVWWLDREAAAELEA